MSIALVDSNRKARVTSSNLVRGSKTTNPELTILPRPTRQEQPFRDKPHKQIRANILTFTILRLHRHADLAHHENRRRTSSAHRNTNNARNGFSERDSPPKFYGARLPVTQNRTFPEEPKDLSRIVGLGWPRHIANLILPRRPFTHLFKRPLLSLLLVHPPSLHRRNHKILIDLLKRQQLTLHISTVNTIRIIRILSTMIHIRAHRPATALTLSRKRQPRPLDQTGSISLDNHTWTTRPGTR
jgi:hypothetical protein